MSVDPDTTGTTPAPAAGTEVAGPPTDAGDGSRRDARPAGRRWLVVLAWCVAFGLWSVACFVWLFPWLAEMGLDPTLGS